MRHIKRNRRYGRKSKTAVVMLFGALLLCLGGCSAGDGRAKDAGAADNAAANTVQAEKPGTEDGRAKDAGAADNAAANTAQTENAAREQNSAAAEQADGEGSGPRSYLVENPQDGYYGGEEEAVSDKPAFELKLSFERANGITDEQAWLAENELTKPSFPYEDGQYRYEVSGEEAYSPIVLELYDLERNGLAARLDFSAYRYADDFAEEDRDFVEQRILWAKAENHILYAAIAHNTYAASSPHTAYVVAFDLDAGRVLWKSEPLMCNSAGFELMDGSVVCGYGFTSEADWLNVLDAGSGRLQQQIPLHSKAEYIVRKDDMLYVRSYDTDYRFEIVKTGAAPTAEKEQSSFMELYDGSFEKEIKLAGTKIRFRMVVVDAALGNRVYGLLKSRDDGVRWEEVSLNPFASQLGMAVDFTFLDENFGFATLAHGGGDSADLWVTQDGGKSYGRAALEEYSVASDDGGSYAPYDFPKLPYEQGGSLYVLCGQGADGDYNGGDGRQMARYRSVDGGYHFSFDGMEDTVEE